MSTKISDEVIDKLNEDLNDLKSNKKFLSDQLYSYEKKIDSVNRKLDDAKAAREEIQEAAQKAQEGVQIHFSEVVTSALHAVDFNEYIFSPVFERRRNRTECDMILKKGKHYFKPEHFVGGTVLDICAFGLRMAMWKLEGTAPVIIFDEPFKLVDRDILPSISMLVKESSQEFGVQMIIVTHYDDLEGADKEFVIDNGRVL